MKKQTVLLISLAILVIALLAAFALTQTPQPTEDTPVREETTEEAPVTESEERPQLEPDPVFATARVTDATTLKVAEAPQTATLIVEGASFPIRVAEGATFEAAMEALRDEGSFTYKARTYTGLGSFVEEIQGKASTSEYYWILHVNGKKSAAGISQTRISSGDVIEWKYEKKY